MPRTVVVAEMVVIQVKCEVEVKIRTKIEKCGWFVFLQSFEHATNCWGKVVFGVGCGVEVKN